MKIKNYTSSVPVIHTIARIEETLVRAGAHGVRKDFVGNRLAALDFTIRNGEKDISIRLPANVEAVYKAFADSRRRLRPESRDLLRAQAERTAWKLMQDWVEVQLSLIRLEQADLLQVFLPYVWDGRRTFYDALKDTGFKALMPPKP